MVDRVNGVDLVDGADPVDGVDPVDDVDRQGILLTPLRSWQGGGARVMAMTRHRILRRTSERR